MKNKIQFLVLLLFCISINAQVGINTTTPDASSILDVSSTDKGLLIPNVSLSNITDTQLDGVNTAANGLLIYNTNFLTTGGSGVGYYYFNGTTWEMLSIEKNVSDWFKENTSILPTDINDDIYTQGNVAIGKTTSDYALDVLETTEDRALNISLSSSTAGSNYGSYIENTNSGTGFHYGAYHKLSGTGAGNNCGSYQIIDKPNASSYNYGTYNKLLASGTQYGTYNNIAFNGNGLHIGTSNKINGTGDSDVYGVDNSIVSSGNGNHYGTSNVLNGDGTGTHYGVYTLIKPTALGFNYGVYSESLSANSYAGYFLGNVSIGTTMLNNYILPSTRGTMNQILQTDGSGNVSWVDENTVSYNDWFEEGTTTGPNNINDDIYTQGNVAIGKTTADYALDIEETTEDRGVNVKVSGADNNIKYGLYVENLNTGTNTHYGTYNTLSGTGSGYQYGSYQNISNIGSGIHFGSLNLLSGSGVGLIYGSTQIITNTGDGMHFGNYNELTGNGNGQQKASVNYITNTGNGSHMGSYNALEGSGSGNHFGTYNLLLGTGSGDQYGSYNNIEATGGTNFGVYSEVLKSGSYAGYFLGNVSIGTTDSNNYILPSIRGTINQIMQTDGAGNVSWVDATTLPSFWKRTGTNLDVATIADDIQFSSDQTSITFPATTGTPAPMINMFASGSSNAKRMVLAHSSSYPTYGLEYDDSSDMFRFLSSGNPVVEIDLVAGYPLRVYGTARATDFQSDLNNYPDYVFENYYNKKPTIKSDYSFLSINEVEDFIKENGHLPNVKSYQEIEEQGMTINLAETSVTNLEKIEELFLFVIELNNENELLKQQLENQQKEIDEILKLLKDK